MVIDRDLLDLALVISLGVLAFSSLLFLAFFIPVLIQLAKTLEAAYALIAVFKNYALSVHQSLDSAKQGAIKMASYVSEVFSSLVDGVTDLFLKKK